MFSGQQILFTYKVSSNVCAYRNTVGAAEGQMSRSCGKGKGQVALPNA